MSILNTYLHPLTGDIITDAKRITEWKNWSLSDVLELEKTIQNPQEFFTLLLKAKDQTPYPWQREVLDSLLTGHNHVIAHARQIGITTLLQCYVMIKTLQSRPDILYLLPYFHLHSPAHQGMEQYRDGMPFFMDDLDFIPICGNNARGPYSRSQIRYGVQVPRGMEFDLVIVDEAAWMDVAPTSLATVNPTQIIICSTLSADDGMFKRLFTNPPNGWKSMAIPYNKGQYSSESLDSYRVMVGEEAFQREMECKI